MNLSIEGPAGKLEASYQVSSDQKQGEAQHAALLCHPHPSYGGSMHDGVLAVTASVLENDAPNTHWAHLRFNFRGVGNSDGQFDNGLGEQADLIAAWEWLRAQQDWQSLALIGYSFGSAMAWSAHKSCAGLTKLLLIAPPTAAMPFATAQTDIQNHVIVGGDDDYCDLNSLPGDASCEVLPGTDHFFSGSTAELSQAVTRWLGS